MIRGLAKWKGQVADLKRRIPTLKRLIKDCDRLVGELDQEIRSEENRVKIHDPKAVAYSAYTKATTSRRDYLDALPTTLGLTSEKPKRHSADWACTLGYTPLLERAMSRDCYRMLTLPAVGIPSESIPRFRPVALGAFLF